MTQEEFRVRFWGTRGSLPVSGPQFRHFGGNTACVEMRCGPHRLVFDVGTGAKPAGKALMAEGIEDLHLFFTHCHYDHILGLPFFAPLFCPKKDVKVWSGHLAGKMTTRTMLEEFVRPPWFPVELDVCRASISCRDFRSGDVLQPYPGVTVRTGSLYHPGGCIGYRVEWAGKAVAYVSDTEHEEGRLDETALDLMRGAELAIYDTMYTDEEMAHRRGFGHSTWRQGVKLAQAAGAKRLALFHHDPSRSDAELRAIERDARNAFKGAFAAFDGQTLAF